MTDPAPEPQPTEPTEPTEPTPGEPGPTEPTTPGEPEGEPSEAQPPEGEPPPAGEGDEAAEPVEYEPMSEKQMEQMAAKLDKESTRHGNRLSEIMGEAANDLLACPLCEPTTQGYLYPPEVTEPRDELHGALLAVLAEGPPAELQDDPNANRCTACEGLGRLKTGSQVPEHATRVCAVCSGFGFVDRGMRTANGQATAPIALAPEPVAEAPPRDDSRDPWGRERGHPDFGRLPEYAANPTPGVPSMTPGP